MPRSVRGSDADPDTGRSGASSGVAEGRQHGPIGHPGPARAQLIGCQKHLRGGGSRSQPRARRRSRGGRAQRGRRWRSQRRLSVRRQRQEPRAGPAARCPFGRNLRPEVSAQVTGASGAYTVPLGRGRGAFGSGHGQCEQQRAGRCGRSGVGGGSRARVDRGVLLGRRDQVGGLQPRCATDAPALGALPAGHDRRRRLRRFLHRRRPRPDRAPPDVAAGGPQCYG